MLPLKVRGKLFTYGFKANDVGLQQVPLFSLQDIFLVLRFGWKKSYRIFNLFTNYRQNLSIEITCGLTRVWPRTVYLLYYYLLFWWAQYCEVQEDLIQRPDRSLVAETFMRYIVEVDNMIDQPNGSDFLLNQPSDIQKHPNVWPCIQEMDNCISKLSLPESEIAKIEDLRTTFNEESLDVTRNALDRFNPNADEIIQDKEKTVGELFKVWVEILNILYKVPSELADSSPSIMLYAGMAVQVLDDMTDLPFDYRSNVDNIFHEFLKAEPDEMKKAEQHIREITWDHLDSAWAKENLPKTFDKAYALTEYYLEKIPAISRNQTASIELQSDIRKMWVHTLGI